MDWGPGYREQPPPAGLLPSVACLWARVVGPPADAVAEVLPDACVDLIWEQGRGLFVAGPDTGPVPSATPAGTVLAAVRFAPGAAGPALGLPMSELLNQRVDDVSIHDGKLELTFGDCVVTVLPNDHQVSWSVRGPDVTRASCIAEGHVVWE